MHPNLGLRDTNGFGRVGVSTGLCAKQVRSGRCSNRSVHDTPTPTGLSTTPMPQNHTHIHTDDSRPANTEAHTHTDARQTTHTYVPAKTYTHPYAHSDRLNASSAHAHKMYASTMGWCVVVGCVFFCSNRRRQGRPTDPTLREKAFGAGERRSSASTSSTRSRTPMMGAESTANVRTIGNR